MKLFIFTVWCLSGVIWEIDGTSTDLVGRGEYTLEYPNGCYLYVSEHKDSLWFYIEDGFYYSHGDSTKFKCLTN